MNCKKLFLEQYKACYDEENWFPPVKKAVEGLTEEQAKQKIGGSINTIFQLVQHLIFWNERYLLRFLNKPLTEIRKSDEDSSFEIDIKDWDSTLKKLNEVFEELHNAFENAVEEKLINSPFKDSNTSWYSVMANINIHNAYHIGQIIYMRKIQGSWIK